MGACTDKTNESTAHERVTVSDPIKLFSVEKHWSKFESSNRHQLFNPVLLYFVLNYQEL
jgi:hypothetical protein